MLSSNYLGVKRTAPNLTVVQCESKADIAIFFEKFLSVCVPGCMSGPLKQRQRCSKGGELSIKKHLLIECARARRLDLLLLILMCATKEIKKNPGCRGIQSQKG